MGGTPATNGSARGITSVLVPFFTLMVLPSGRDWFAAGTPYHNVFKEQNPYQWDEHRSYVRLYYRQVALDIPTRGIGNAAFHPTIKTVGF
ncbi:hypothetical protein JIR001_07310 [Polycladomyces abyssicola]|uniref:Uncharacterized protein n=1 Tax=Polycladomyces abyssicola TaxID=1125966 RepID=A0A8D5UEU6_9BACL|nr:hypothetical protein JIR001_07310 [Polycladomyces abyssicola]